MDLKYLKEIAEILSRSDTEEFDRASYRNLKNELQQEIEYIEKNRQAALDLLDILFKRDIPKTVEFYNSLREFAFAASFNSFSKDGRQLIGILLTESCKKLNVEDAQKLLSLLSDGEVDVFLFLKSLQRVIAEIKLSPVFVSELFKTIERRIRNDFAGGDFYDAVQTYGISYPREGLKVIEIYFNEGFDDGTLHIASILLGYIRAIIEDFPALKHDFETWNEKLYTSKDTKKRLCYHRSWAFTFLKSKLAFTELEFRLDVMLNGEEDETNEAYAVLQRCLLHDLSNPDFLLQSLKWLYKNAAPNLSAVAKHYIIEILWRLVEPVKVGSIKIADLNQILLKSLPIPQESAGTWNSLNIYLHDVLKVSGDDFKDAILMLIDSNPEGFIHALEKNIFYVFSDTTQFDFSEIVAALLFSANKNRRVVGVKLFTSLKGLKFSKEMLANYDMTLILAVLTSFMLNTYQAKDIAQFFLLFEQLWSDSDSPERNIFKDEMIYQAINYPEGVLGVFKQVTRPSVLIEEVVKSADKYFEGLRNLKESPVNSFAFAGYDEAMSKAYRDFSSQINMNVKEKSILAKLARNVDLIYGSTFSFTTEGNITSPSNFSEISHSVEFPRIEIIDPEGTAIRRMHMIRRMQGLDD